jgi:hypothetical protein
VEVTGIELNIKTATMAAFRGYKIIGKNLFRYGTKEGEVRGVKA